MDVRPDRPQPVDLGTVSCQSVKALVARHGTALREAQLHGKNVDQVTLEQEDAVAAYMKILGDDQRRLFGELYAEEMQRLMAQLLVEADERRLKRLSWTERRTRSSDQAATWFFIIMLLLVLTIVTKA